MKVNCYCESFNLDFPNRVCSPNTYYLDPNPPTNLVVSLLTADGVDIEWTAPTTGMYKTFQVTIKDGSSVVKTDTPAKETTTSVFTGLEAGKEYTATVVTVNGDGEDARMSTPKTVTFATSEYLFILCKVYINV